MPGALPLAPVAPCSGTGTDHCQKGTGRAVLPRARVLRRGRRSQWPTGSSLFYPARSLEARPQAGPATFGRPWVLFPLSLIVWLSASCLPPLLLRLSLQLQTWLQIAVPLVPLPPVVEKWPASGDSSASCLLAASHTQLTAHTDTTHNKHRLHCFARQTHESRQRMN